MFPSWYMKFLRQQLTAVGYFNKNSTLHVWLVFDHRLDAPSQWKCSPQGLNLMEKNLLVWQLHIQIRPDLPEEFRL